MPTYENETGRAIAEQNNRHTKTKNPDECGAIWVKLNSNNVEYLSLKLELDGKTYNLKGFLNSAKSEGDNRPEYIAFKSKNIKKEINGNR